MEDEEQKPKDIILNGEVKREIENFLEKVKKEPMEDEHCEQIIPKQETQELFKNVKEEPIYEEYFDQIVPKLEEVIAPPTSDLRNQEFHANNQIHKFFTETPNGSYKSGGELQEKLHRCSVCLVMKPRITVKSVTMEEDKLVTMIGCVLRGDYTLDQAQLFMSMRRRINICYAHLSEAINKIYEVLNIKSPDEITSCSSKLMDNLMITVNALNPQVKTEQFCGIIHNFVRRNISQKRKAPNTKGEQHKKQTIHRCFVCTRVHVQNNIKQVTMKDDKLILMIRCFLHGEYSLQQAHSFISEKKQFYICHIHFSQSIDEIYKFLDIKQPDEVYSCSTELMTNLLVTVNELDPWITSLQFCYIFDKFVTRNMKFLDIMITPTRMKFEKQKPKGIISNEIEIKQEMEDVLENVKEEPMEEKYSEQIVPKLEEIMEKADSDVRDQTSQLEMAQTFIPKLDVEPEKDQEELHVKLQNNNNYSVIQTPRCFVCLQIRPCQFLKYVTMEDDKLILMVGRFLRGDCSLDQAQLFISGKRKVCICFVHFFESINKIYDDLNIKNNVKITSCSSELMDNLMVTVNNIYPSIDSSQFCDMLHNSVRRNISQKRKGETNTNQRYFLCSVCAEKQSSNNMKRVPLQTDKLLIMIGCVLRGDHSIEQAQVFMSQMNKVYICNIHFSEVLKEIYKALSIKHPDEVFACSVELMNLMITVNKLDPQFAPWQLQIGLNEFYTRNKNLF